MYSNEQQLCRSQLEIGGATVELSNKTSKTGALGRPWSIQTLYLQTVMKIKTHSGNMFSTRLENIVNPDKRGV